MGETLVSDDVTPLRMTSKDFLRSVGWTQNKAGRWVPAGDTGVTMFEAALIASVSAGRESGMNMRSGHHR